MSAKTFAADLRKFARQLDIDAGVALKRLLFEAWTRIIMRSPVDTGRFRNSWTMQEGSPNESTREAGYYLNRVPSMPDVVLTSPWTIVFLNNSLPYAEPLERGSSKQAPAGMVLVTTIELQNWLRITSRQAA